MPDDVRVSRKELEAALDALGLRGTPVYSAHKVKGKIVLHLCGRTRPVTWSPPKVEPKVELELEPEAEAKPEPKKKKKASKKP